METLSSCPICNHHLFKAFLSCKDYTVSRETFQIVECENCGFHFTNPRPAEEKIARYYQSEEYIAHSGTKKGIVNRVYHIVRNYTLAKKLQLLVQTAHALSPRAQALSPKAQAFSSKAQAQSPETPAPSPGAHTLSLKEINILDYGCGTGEFLNICKKAGFQTTGIEPEDKARIFAINNYGLNILPQNSLSSFKNDFFDIVTLWHVLEHIHRLNEFLNELKRILKGGGVAIIAVPNLTSLDAKIYKEFWAAYDVPRHLYHFSPKDISKLFSEYGFELEDVKPMPFDAFYVSMLSEKYKNQDNKYKNVENGNKKNSGNLISAILKGAKSNIFASNSEYTFSSQIYILKKRN